MPSNVVLKRSLAAAAVLAAVGVPLLGGTVASANASVTFTAAADTYVRSDYPTTNYGKDTTLATNASPVTTSYVRFNVQGLAAPVTKATLRVYSYAISGTGYQVSPVTDNTWGETSVTYTNAPQLGAQLGTSGAITNNAWTSVDVTSAVSGNGPVSLGLTTTSTTGKRFASRETTATPPQLVVETGTPVGTPASITGSGGDGQSAPVNSTFGTPLTARVTDSSGNPVAAASVTFTAPSSGAGGTFAGGGSSATATTDSTGTATAAFTANAVVGGYAVQATVAGVGQAASFALTNTPPPGASVNPTAGTPQSAAVSTAFGTNLAVAMTDPAGQAVTGATVTFTAPSSGASGTFPGGSATVTATTDGTGTATAPPFTANATGGTYSVTAGVAGVTQSASFALTNTSPVISNDPVIAAAGDIACTAGKTVTASSCQQQGTSNLLVNLHPDAVLPLGDDQYETGELSDFQSVYDPSWGRLNGVVRPIPGNHEWGYIGTAVTPTGGQGYFSYFGDKATPLQPGCSVNCTSWYSWDIGSWHMIALDSQCPAISGGCSTTSPEAKWLKSDLAAHPNQCTLAYWHIPVFSSSQDHQPDMTNMLQILYNAGADVVLNGHAHFYERFAPQTPQGTADPARGITEFIAGTGGKSFFPTRSTPAANSVVSNNTTFGVLKMTLHAGSYDWQFVPEPGSSGFTDSGTGSCH
jgi:hypothetical protein